MSWSKKKFWSSFNIVFSDEQKAYVILIDDKIYKSAKGNILKIPSAFLAKKVENEWEKITKEVIRSKLIFTNVLEQINDIDDESTVEFLRVLLEYAETDLLCYRASSPKKFGFTGTSLNPTTNIPSAAIFPRIISNALAWCSGSRGKNSIPMATNSALSRKPS